MNPSPPNPPTIRKPLARTCKTSVHSDRRPADAIAQQPTGPRKKRKSTKLSTQQVKSGCRGASAKDLRTRAPRVPKGVIEWREVELGSMRLSYRSDAINHVYNKDKRNIVKIFKVGFQTSRQAHRSGQLVLLATFKNAGRICQTVFPNDFVVDILLFESTYSIDIRFHEQSDAGDPKLIMRWTFGLGNPEQAQKAHALYNRVVHILQNMSRDAVRYTNVPRLITMPADTNPALDLSSLNTRSTVLTAAAISSGRSSTVKLPHRFRIQMVFTGLCASSEFLAEMEKLEQGSRIGGDLVVAGGNDLGLADNNSSTTSRPTAAAITAPRPGPMSLAGSCGDLKCLGGMVPVTAVALRRLREGKEWIGCQAAQNCKSPSFWFHLKGGCAGITPEVMRGNRVWWCSLCRVSRRGVDAKGVQELNLQHGTT